MNDDTWTIMLQRLNQGDEAAAAEVFVSLAPLLRAHVRRQLAGSLRSKFDSTDVVQAVWLRLMTGFRSGKWEFADAAHLRAFLLKVTHNHFLEQVRHYHHAIAHETPESTFDPKAPDVDRPSAVVQAHDAWERLLALCPPAHRELLRMRQEGLQIAEIAARSGLHESSVRRIFYELSRTYTTTAKDRVAEQNEN